MEMLETASVREEVIGPMPIVSYSLNLPMIQIKDTILDVPPCMYHTFAWIYLWLHKTPVSNPTIPHQVLEVRPTMITHLNSGTFTPLTPSNSLNNASCLSSSPASSLNLLNPP